MRVYLAQLKCPGNHCVVALAHEFATLEKAQALRPLVMAAFQSLVTAGKLKYECVICLSQDLHVDIGPTIWRTIQEAEPMLRAAEAEAVMTTRAIRASRN